MVCTPFMYLAHYVVPTTDIALCCNFNLSIEFVSGFIYKRGESLFSDICEKENYTLEHLANINLVPDF